MDVLNYQRVATILRTLSMDQLYGHCIAILMVLDPYVKYLETIVVWF